MKIDGLFCKKLLFSEVSIFKSLTFVDLRLFMKKRLKIHEIICFFFHNFNHLIRIQ